MKEFFACYTALRQAVFCRDIFQEISLSSTAVCGSIQHEGYFKKYLDTHADYGILTACTAAVSPTIFGNELSLGLPSTYQATGKTAQERSRHAQWCSVDTSLRCALARLA